MHFSTWLRTWLARHPLKEPRNHDPARYRTEVMEKVRALHQPAHMPAASPRWFSWPRIGLAMATVAVGLVLVAISSQRAQVHLADQIVHESSVVAELDDPNFVPAANGDVDSLAEEVETLDTMTLAESTPSDDQWLDQTLSLLDQLDEDDAGPTDSSSEEEWLKELQLLDDTELSASS